MGCAISAAIKDESTDHASAARTKLVVQGESVTDAYLVGNLLGRGSFAVVYRVQKNVDQSTFALKLIPKNNSKFNYDLLMQEAAVMQRVKHFRCLALHEIYEDSESINLIIELAGGGELLDRVAEMGYFSEQSAAKIISQVLEGIVYLHSIGVCHRDLKPENLLMMSRDPASPGYSQVKIADFGLSSIKADVYVDTMKTACGTTEWMAPEVVDAVIERANLLKFLSYKNSRYTAKIDVWAVGGILYTLCCGRPPFYDDNMASIMRNITQGHYSFFSPTWDQVSDEVKGFIASMLQLDPKKRPTASQCRENMWLRNDEGISQTNLHVGELLNVYNRARRQTKVMIVVSSVARMETLARRRRSSAEGASILSPSATMDSSVSADSISSADNPGVSVDSTALGLQAWACKARLNKPPGSSPTSGGGDGSPAGQLSSSTPAPISGPALDALRAEDSSNSPRLSPTGIEGFKVL